MSMSDRVTIIRKGELIDTLNTKDISHRRTCKSCGRNTS
ncbi:Putative deoxyribose-specific ABC transporter, ATP-binding protein [Candidatus Arthromitus sp. SFB-mouse-NL]|nr:Putative deoxyribose-specific ABC transporter, ATP-binding protein [Candidatus Arthromitus sp. SFB-mouse-NL]